VSDVTSGDLAVSRVDWGGRVGSIRGSAAVGARSVVEKHERPCHRRADDRGGGGRPADLLGTVAQSALAMKLREPRAMKLREPRAMKLREPRQ
jgi:hypothetical protein